MIWWDEKCQQFLGPKKDIKIGSFWRGGQRQELSPSVLRRRMIGIRRRRYCRSIPLSLSQPDTTTIRLGAIMFHPSYQTKTVYADRYLSHSQKHQSKVKDFRVYCISEELLLFDMMPNSGLHVCTIICTLLTKTLKNDGGGDGDMNLVEFSYWVGLKMIKTRLSNAAWVEERRTISQNRVNIIHPFTTRWCSPQSYGLII